MTYKDLPASINFNPRSLAGATIADYFAAGGTAISIHAPLRERRYIASNVGAGIKYFNPRSLAGATHLTYLRIPRPNRFQSTLPCGSDYHLYYHPMFAIVYFNPRSLAGATDEAVMQMQFSLIFQSTLPCGSDCYH